MEILEKIYLTVYLLSISIFLHYGNGGKIFFNSGQLLEAERPGEDGGGSVVAVGMREKEVDWIHGFERTGYGR